MSFIRNQFEVEYSKIAQKNGWNVTPGSKFFKFVDGRYINPYSNLNDSYKLFISCIEFTLSNQNKIIAEADRAGELK